MTEGLKIHEVHGKTSGGAGKFSQAKAWRLRLLPQTIRFSRKEGSDGLRRGLPGNYFS